MNVVINSKILACTQHKVNDEITIPMNGGKETLVYFQKWFDEIFNDGVCAVIKKADAVRDFHFKDVDGYGELKCCFPIIDLANDCVVLIYDFKAYTEKKNIKPTPCKTFFSDPMVNEWKCLNCGCMKSEHVKKPNTLPKQYCIVELDLSAGSAYEYTHKSIIPTKIKYARMFSGKIQKGKIEGNFNSVKLHDIVYLIKRGCELSDIDKCINTVYPND